MDIGFFSQRSPSLLNNLLPEVKKGMDERSYSIHFFIYGPPCMKRKASPVIVANDNLVTELN